MYIEYFTILHTHVNSLIWDLFFTIATHRLYSINAYLSLFHPFKENDRVQENRLPVWSSFSSSHPFYNPLLCLLQRELKRAWILNLEWHFPQSHLE